MPITIQDFHWLEIINMSVTLLCHGRSEWTYTGLVLRGRNKVFNNNLPPFKIKMFWKHGTFCRRKRIKILLCIRTIFYGEMIILGIKVKCCYTKWINAGNGTFFRTAHIPKLKHVSGRHMFQNGTQFTSSNWLGNQGKRQTLALAQLPQIPIPRVWTEPLN